MARATRELLASRTDVWAFVSTPGRLAGTEDVAVELRPSGVHETGAERLEGLVGFALHAGGPTDAFAESILDSLSAMCQTGADG